MKPDMREQTIIAHCMTEMNYRVVRFEYRTTLKHSLAERISKRIPAVVRQMADDGTTLVKKNFTFILPEDESRNIAFAWFKRGKNLDKIITEPDGQAFKWSNIYNRMLATD